MGGLRAAGEAAASRDTLALWFPRSRSPGADDSSRGSPVTEASGPDAALCPDVFSPSMHKGTDDSCPSFKLCQGRTVRSLLVKSFP